jgi:hypothetical protein
LWYLFFQNPSLKEVFRDDFKAVFLSEYQFQQIKEQEKLLCSLFNSFNFFVFSDLLQSKPNFGAKQQ